MLFGQITKIQWKENRDAHWWESFNFLLTQFKRTYLPRIFPNSSSSCDLYNPTCGESTIDCKFLFSSYIDSSCTEALINFNADIPEPRQPWNSNRNRRPGSHESDFLSEYLEQLQVHFIKWIANYVAPLENNGEVNIVPGLLSAAASMAGSALVQKKKKKTKRLSCFTLGLWSKRWQNF